MKYQAGQNLPWWFKTYILRKKGLKKPVLYKFDTIHQNEAKVDVTGVKV